jgi:hypothetical protein
MASYFFISAAMKFLNAAPCIGAGVRPFSSSALTRLSLAGNCATSELILPATAGGRPFGANTPNQFVSCRAGIPNSVVVGTSGSILSRTGRTRYGERLQLASPDVLNRRDRRPEEQVNLATQQVGQSGCRSAIGNMGERQAGQTPQQLTSQMLLPANARRSIGDRPRDNPGPAADSPLENETARHMLEIAERLFAGHGVELVPLRQIVVEAGQRNRSALPLSRRRGWAATSALSSRLRSARWPMPSTTRPWGARYVKVLAQATFSPSLLHGEMIDAEAMSGVIRARRMIAAALPEIPRKVLHHRQQWFSQSVVYSLAQWSEGPPAHPPVVELADYCTAGLTAPVSKGRRVWRGGKARQA